MKAHTKHRVGVVGYGHLGQYLVHKILQDEAVKEKLELAFVWNRTTSKVSDDGLVPRELICTDLDDFERFGADIIAEVSHPSISVKYGPRFARSANFFVGSPTAFADAKYEAEMRRAADEPNGFGIYVPAGALWGAQDIQKMAQQGSIAELTITMAKHPSSLKLEGCLKERLAHVSHDAKEETVIYEGSVRELCPLAPNNVNTMACAAMAAHSLGFDKVRGRLVADPRIQAHIITIDVTSPAGSDGQAFKVSTVRFNPAAAGAVTGNATYASFLSSLLLAHGRGGGIHFC
jgi:aspartate dehydrogenase